MKITYIILAYKNLELLKHTINVLDDEDISFIIHIDKKSRSLFNWECLKAKDNITLLSYKDVTWGGIEMVEVIVSLLPKAISQNPNGYCILLSESDYPIKTNKYIKSYLENNPYNFIFGQQIPYYKGWIEGGRRKTKCYALRLSNERIASIEPHKFNLSNLRQFLKVILYNHHKFRKALQILYKYPKRQHPDYLIPFGGEFWWVLKSECIQIILNFLNKHPDFIEYHQNTVIPDEIFMNTLVYNLFDPKEIKNSALRYINWTGKGNSPKDITLKNTALLERILQSPDVLFARKITDISVCYYIDKYLNQHK